MPYSFVNYTGNGTITDFSVTFPYLDKSHVEVLVGGILQTLTTNYSWLNSTTVRLVTAPASGVVVKLQRKSSRSTKLVDFQDATVLTEADLDKSASQAFYLAQEALDVTEPALGADGSAAAAANSASQASTSATNAAASATQSANSATESATYSNARVRNYIIGGDFSTNPWQRGTSFTGITGPAYTADRFMLSCAASGTWSVAQIADAPTFAQAGRAISHCLEARVTAADTVIGGTDSAVIYHGVEGYNYLPLYQKSQLIGFWAKSNVIGDFGVSLRNNAADRSYVSKITINAIDTWEYKTVSISTAPSGGTWNFTNGAGVHIEISLVGGTSHQTATLDAWQSANVRMPPTQVNLAAAVNNYFRLADVKLIEGLVDVTPYQPTAEETITACQRYFKRIPNFRVSGSTEAIEGSILAPNMRAAPTFSGGGAGFTTSVLEKTYFLAYQTTAALVTLDINAEL